MRAAAGIVLAVSVVVMIVAADPLLGLAVAALALCCAAFLDRPAAVGSLRAGLLLAMFFTAALTAAVVAWAEGPGRGIESGGMVLLRLLVLTTAAAVLVRRVDAEALLALAKRAGLERLGLVLGLALNSMPRIVEASSQVWVASSFRSSGAADRLRRLPDVGEVLLAHVGRIADEAAAAASLRGHSALTRPDLRPRHAIRTVVITGPPNSGKTAAVGRLVERLRRREVPLAGFTQLGIWENDAKTGFTIRDLGSGETAPLARLPEGAAGDFGTRFQFFDEGFTLGRKSLAGVRPGGIVVADELGPVELRGGGHMPAIRKALATPGLSALVVVVRRSLVPSFVHALDARDAVVIDLGEPEVEPVEAVLGALELSD